MESRSGAVSSEQLAAIEDEEVLNKMVSQPSFDTFDTSDLPLWCEASRPKSSVAALSFTLWKEGQRLTSLQTPY